MRLPKDIKKSVRLHKLREDQGATRHITPVANPNLFCAAGLEHREIRAFYGPFTRDSRARAAIKVIIHEQESQSVPMHFTITGQQWAGEI